MKVSILLPAYKSEQLLKEVFFPSLHNITCDWELIIRDNGGNGNIRDMITDFRSDQIVICGNGHNVGLNKALNQASVSATGEFYFLPHSDMHILPGCLEALMNAAKNQAPGSFLFCSRSVEKASHIPMQVLRDFGTTVEDFNEKGLNEFLETYKDNGIVSGYRMPFFLDRKLWDKMGGVDEQFFSYATDNDLFLSAYHKKVRKFWMINSSLVYHLSGHSNKQQNVDRDDKDPYYKLVDKWKKLGYDITMDIDASEQKLVPWNIKVK